MVVGGGKYQIHLLYHLGSLSRIAEFLNQCFLYNFDKLSMFFLKIHADRKKFLKNFLKDTRTVEIGYTKDLSPKESNKAVNSVRQTDRNSDMAPAG